MAISRQGSVITNLEDPQKIADFYGTSFRTVSDSIPVLVQSMMAKMYVKDAVSPFDIARNAKIEQWYEDETGRPWSEENATKPISPFLFGPPGHGKSIAFRLASKFVAQTLGMRYLDNSSLAEDGRIKLPPMLPDGLEDDIATGKLDYPPANEVGPNDFVFLTYEMSGEVAKGDFGGPPDIRETQVSYIQKDEHGRILRNEDGQPVFTSRTERYSTRAMPWMLVSFQKAGGGMLVLDDFTNAAPYIQNIGLGLFQNGSYQSLAFPATVLIGGTGNQGVIDGTHADPMGTALKGRIDAHYTQDTLADYTSRINDIFDPKASPARNMFANIVGQFLSENTSMFATLPPGDIMVLRGTDQRISEDDLQSMLNHPDENERWHQDDIADHVDFLPSPGTQGYPSPRNWDNTINSLGALWLAVPVVGHPEHEKKMASFLTLMEQQLVSDVGPKAATQMAPFMAEQIISQGYLDLGAQVVRRSANAPAAPLPQKLIDRMTQTLQMPSSGKKTAALGWMVDGAYREMTTMLEHHDLDEINAALDDPAHPVRALFSGYLKVAAASGREDIFERATERLIRGFRSDSDFVKSGWMQPHPDDASAVALSAPARQALTDIVASLQSDTGASLPLSQDMATQASRNIQAPMPLSPATPAPEVGTWEVKSWVQAGTIPPEVATNYWSYETTKRAAWAGSVIETFVDRPAGKSPTPLSHAVGLVSSLDAVNAKVFLDDLVDAATATATATKSPSYLVTTAFWLNQVKDNLSGDKATELSGVVQEAMDKSLAAMKSMTASSPTKPW